MEQLVSQGKVLYVGSSNFAGIHIAQAQHSARDRNFFGLVSEQKLYNLNARTVELEVIPACRTYGLGLIPYSPLAEGMLAGALIKTSKARRSSERLQEAIEKYKHQLETYEKFCHEMNEEPANIALAWLLHNPIVTAPIIGPRTQEQLTGSLRSLEIKFDDEQMNTLDQIWPGPGGEAPEAYAW